MRYLFDNPKQTKSRVYRPKGSTEYKDFSPGLRYASKRSVDGQWEQVYKTEDTPYGPRHRVIKVKDCPEHWEALKNFVFEATFEVRYAYASSGISVVDIDTNETYLFVPAEFDRVFRGFVNGQITPLGNNRFTGRFTWAFHNGELSVMLYEDPHAVH